MDYPCGPSWCKLYFGGAFDGQKWHLISTFLGGDFFVRVFLFSLAFLCSVTLSRSMMSMAVHSADSEERNEYGCSRSDAGMGAPVMWPPKTLGNDRRFLNSPLACKMCACTYVTVVSATW